MTGPVFSIATPTRNALAKLRRCVGSVRGQTGVSLEHRIQDARSTDGTAQWLAAQPDVHAVSEADGGMYDAINRAWAGARGRYLSWLNSDEQYLPGTLERVARYFDTHPAVDAVFGNYVVALEDGRPVALRQEIPLRPLVVKHTFLNAYSCTLFYRRRLFESGALNLDTRYRYAADLELILRLAASGAVIHHIPEYLSVFGIDGSNLSTHPGMLEEAEAIRLKFGAVRSPLIRSGFMAARRLERLLRGAYRPAPFRYRYAVNEVPDYLEVAARDLGGRYALKDGAPAAAPGSAPGPTRSVRPP